MEKVTGSDTTEQLSLSESSLGNKKGHEVTHWSHPSMINRFSHVRLFVTLWDNPGSSVHGESPGKNSGVGCHVLLQGIVPTSRSNLSLLHCRRVLCSHPTLSNRTFCDYENVLHPHCSIQQPLATLRADTIKGLSFKGYSILTNISLDLNSHMLRDQQLPFWAALDAQPLRRGNWGKGQPCDLPPATKPPKEPELGTPASSFSRVCLRPSQTLNVSQKRRSRARFVPD